MIANAGRREAGFSLLEMLVALVVLGFLLVGLGQAVRFGLEVYRHQTAMLDSGGRRDAVDRALRGLIVRARPGQSVAGTRHRLVLLTALPMAGGKRVIDAAIFVDRRHRLVMDWAPHRFGVGLGAPPPVRRIVLLRGVDSLAVGYWWPRTVFGAPVWRARGPVGGVPGLIRLRIRGDGTSESAAELVAGPALALRH